MTLFMSEILGTISHKKACHSLYHVNEKYEYHANSIQFLAPTAIKDMG